MGDDEIEEPQNANEKPEKGLSTSAYVGIGVGIFVFACIISCWGSGCFKKQHDFVVIEERRSPYNPKAVDLEDMQ